MIETADSKARLSPPESPSMRSQLASPPAVSDHLLPTSSHNQVATVSERSLGELGTTFDYSEPPAYQGSVPGSAQRVTKSPYMPQASTASLTRICPTRVVDSLKEAKLLHHFVANLAVWVCPPLLQLAFTHLTVPSVRCVGFHTPLC